MAGTLPNLATTEDIVARLGRNLTPVESARVEALLADGSAFIRRYCRRDFLPHIDFAADLQESGGEILLPQWPVIKIKRVVLPGPVGINVTWWRFVPPRKLIIPTPEQSGIINLPELEDYWGGLFHVVWDYGFDETPDEVVAVICSAIISELSTPTMSGMVASESVGAYSYSMRRSSGAGLNAAIIDAGMATLNDFRVKQGTIQLSRS